jgi:hypothetical protein
MNLEWRSRYSGIWRCAKVSEERSVSIFRAEYESTHLRNVDTTRTTLRHFSEYT